MHKLADWIDRAFSPRGFLSKMPGHEHRPQQQTMAVEVAQALEEKSHLIVEAGTGIGKSLAYLLPSITHALMSGKKAVVSTHTIHLQEQLFYKDIPDLKKLLRTPFKAALLKGRRNYLCTKRLAHAMKHADDLFSHKDKAELHRIWEWAQATQDGTISELNPQPSSAVWSHVCSEPHSCSTKTCGNDSKCFYHRALQQAADAHIVVINHALFFSSLQEIPENTPRGYLFANDFIILDEAHALEKVASQHLGLEFSTSTFRGLLFKLHNPQTRKGILSMFRKAEAERQIIDILQALELFSHQIRSALDFSKKSEIRIRQPLQIGDSLVAQIEMFRNSLKALRDKNENSQNLLDYYIFSIDENLFNLSAFLSQKEKNHVYWIEKDGKHDFKLLTAPVDVAPLLRRLIFRKNNTAILTSATLSTRDDLKYFQSRIGGETAKTLQLGSPFNFERQMQVFIPSQTPPPTSEGFEKAVIEWMKYFILQTHGKALVLFTSYELMHKVEKQLHGWFGDQQIEFFVQGNGESRQLLLKKFKEDTNSVLFGTDSFWEGIDIPGEALSNVIITQLPFLVPTQPIVEARCELIQMRGGNAFRDYSLPEAILKFRQGIGRLIRNHSDIGQVAILDSRIANKSYGKNFIAKIPPCSICFLDNEVLEECKNLLHISERI